MLYQDYLNSLRWDDVSWSTLYSLLGDLPDEAPLEMFQSACSDQLDLSSDAGTRSSMEIFNRPRITSLATESAAGTDPGQEPPSPVAVPVCAPQLNLKGSSLMGRRGRNLTLSTGT
ncbi:unnamed protein product [Symbiodinium natans]|uniref:Uncharacterized protein n=1 Tax=Symbiodinium natans TaxID=878477 RepID=A0A812J6N2_9DINO|nr:unnamed protein product [Symbiodinium natans]